MQAASGKGTFGVIGIGAMGMGIARNLNGRGYRVGVRDIRPEAEAEAASEGMHVHAHPAALARDCDALAIVVVSAQEIDDVLSGENGILASGVRDKGVFLCSTIAPTDAARFAHQLAENGLVPIDSPISGGPARAQSGAMSMMLAAPAAVLSRYGVLIADLAEKRFHVSELAGDAAKAKLVNNLLAAINLVGAAEAFSLGMKLGLETQTLFDLIASSSGSSWVFSDRIGRAIAGDFVPRAAVPILTKDIRLALELAASVGHDTPMGEGAYSRLRETIAAGLHELDDAAVIKTYGVL